MPKRHGNLFASMFTLDALYQAYLKARRRKRNKAAVANFVRILVGNMVLLV